MNYEETLSYLYNLERFGIKLDLTNITTILNQLGKPHLRFPSIHVAGTNGKGSVAAMLHSILCESGYKAGLYTSPHLVDFRERVRVGQELIEKDFIFDFVQGLKDEIDKEGFTFFEVTTAMTFEYFAQKKVDVAIVETGLGGRLDATNMINPLISIITNIGLEHTKHLGDAIPQIASEKAGIVKDGVPTITAVNQPEALDAIRSICVEKNSEFIHIQDGSSYTVLDASIYGSKFNFSSNSLKYKNLELNLAGEHQVLNAITCLTAIQKLRQLGLRVDEQAVRAGLKKINWRARLEVFKKEPLVLLDVAHNPAGTKALIQALDQLFPERRIIFVFGVMQDKDHDSMLKEISKKAKFVVLTKPDYKRAADPELLREVIDQANIPFEIVPQVNQAYLFALKKAKVDDIICITGSHFTVGEFLGSFQSH
ncbi:MAG: bifunctional folylpolyglutamate synthase/dihydrofolate synthase [candidate division Zixibacteria bacterium]|nr:bifunctional folylpolyglutamate synthase/dihydrofolate synthase [candidate division Zixibacteria bacterium]